MTIVIIPLTSGKPRSAKSIRAKLNKTRISEDKRDKHVLV